MERSEYPVGHALATAATLTALVGARAALRILDGALALLRAARVVAAVGALSLPAACGAAAEDDCRVHADCASGTCGPDGRCVPAADASAIDAPPAPDAASVLDSAVPACAPDHDGTIRRGEVPLAAGLAAPFRIAQNAVVDTAGVAQADGSRRWDLAGMLAGDHVVTIQTLPLDGAWYAARFPSGDYAVRLSDASDLLGVFQARQDALFLLGIVSPEDGAARTELVYDPPVTVLSFPFSSGASWSTSATASGVSFGVPVVVDETYDAAVDAHGRLGTPYGEFPVLRVRTTLVRTVGFQVTTVRSFAFVSECFGAVATIVSHDDEPDVEFDGAAEVRRLEP